MPLLPMTLLGAHEGPAGVLTFGLYLPNVTTASGVTLGLKIIHEADQFLQGIQPLPFALANTPNPAFPGGDYWTVTVDTTVPPPVALPLSSKWGTKGTYVYRYVATPPGKTPIDFIIDPYAREYGVGDLSAITVGFQDHAWSANEATWKTPPLKDMIFYELMISEFGFDIRQAIPMLSYLKDLGINCIEVMPVNDVKNTINWGYDPIGYFGVSERFGNRADFQRFVEAAHQCGLAVVLDAVYGHTTSDFVFPSLYPQLGIANPFNGPVIRDDGYGPKPDFSQPFVQDYFLSINQLWLDKFHLDGFRYDNVPAFWDPATPAAGYGTLVLATLNLVSANLTPPGGAVNYWNRFQSAGVPPTLVQCAEYLNDPPDVLNKTVTNCTWQNQTLGAANDCADGRAGAISELGAQFGLSGYPVAQAVAGGTLPQTALQYIENHDHFRFICKYGIVNPGDDPLLQMGNRDRWFKLQPYLIGLLTAKGVPFLWEGQEICQTYFVPDDGGGPRARPGVFRPVDWSNFYDPIGKTLITLVRKLTSIRNGGAQFRSDNHFFFDTPFYNNAGLLVFSRSLGAVFSMVALNFTDGDVNTTITLPTAGNYREEIVGTQNLLAVPAGAPIGVRIPSNYGQIWTH